MTWDAEPHRFKARRLPQGVLVPVVEHLHQVVVQLRARAVVAGQEVRVGLAHVLEKHALAVLVRVKRLRARGKDVGLAGEVEVEVEGGNVVHGDIGCRAQTRMTNVGKA